MTCVSDEDSEVQQAPLLLLIGRTGIPIQAFPYLSHSWWGK